MTYSLSEAAKAAGKSKTTIHRALKSGRISAARLENGVYVIEPAELHRVFPAVDQERSMDRSSGNSMEQGGTASTTLRVQLEMLERERERERQQLEETITDLREDRDRWRQQATALLENKRPKGLLGRIFSR